MLVFSRYGSYCRLLYGKIGSCFLCWKKVVCCRGSYSICILKRVKNSIAWFTDIPIIWWWYSIGVFVWLYMPLSTRLYYIRPRTYKSRRTVSIRSQKHFGYVLHWVCFGVRLNQSRERFIDEISGPKCGSKHMLFAVKIGKFALRIYDDVFEVNNKQVE